MWPQVDTIGQAFTELIHPQDCDQVESIVQAVFREAQTPKLEEGQNKNFVVRMRTTLSTAVRSQSKIQYKVSVLDV